MIEPQANLKHEIDEDARNKLVAIFDAAAGNRTRFRRWNSGYYSELVRLLRFIVPAGRRVLEVGCADGYVLRQLEPSQGLGIDISPRMIERARAAAAPGENIRFESADIESVRFTETFDYVIMSDLFGNLLDIQQALENVRSACTEQTRVIVNYHSILWEPLLRAVGKLGLKMPNRHQNWISASDVTNFLNLADFEVIAHQRRILLPTKWLPGLNLLFNRVLARLPLINRLCLGELLVLRMRPRPQPRHRTVTLVIPCRNEEGNIRAAITRTPAFGLHQEFIFVDGHSSDRTVEEIHKVMAEFPDKDIQLIHQQRKGKGDAVRLGFAHAHQDVLMILDADLTMPPEELPKFYDAIVAGKGELINGCRLVYPMEKEAMRFLNIVGNKFFSLALSALLGQTLKDTLCGTKVLRKEDYDKIVAGREFFGDFDPFGDFDLLFGASKLKLKIAEIPIRYRDRSYGTTQISRFRHGWLLLKMTALAARKYV